MKVLGPPGRSDLRAMERWMSVRAVILGLLGAAFLAGFSYINDFHVGSDVLVGLHLPTTIFGTLLLIAMLVNPLLYKVRPSWRLAPAELVMSAVLMMVAASVPGVSFAERLPLILAKPAQHNMTLPGWKKHEVLSYAPPSMLPSSGQYESVVLDGLINGNKSRAFGLGDVPWSQWRGPLETWVPLMLLVSGGMICLSLVVHRQWSDHERLRYPIADFAGSLVDQSPGRGLGPLFREKMFWLAMGIVLAVRIINYLGAWYGEDNIPTIPLKLDFSPILKAYPYLYKIPGQKYVGGPLLYPAAIGFAFFLASDVSLSIGLAVYLNFIVVGIMLYTGLSVRDAEFGGGTFTWQRFGSCLGIALVLAKMGRRYYWQVLKSAFGLGRQDVVDSYAVWACRLFLLCMAGATAMLVALGLDLPLAMLLVLLIVIFFITAARFSAEGGLFFITSMWSPAAVLTGLVGGFALGPQAMVIIGLVTMIIAVEPRDCLMPFMVNALKLGQYVRIKPGRVGWSAAGVFLLAMAIAVPATFWGSYKFGMNTDRDYWLTKTASKVAFNAVDKTMTELDIKGELKKSIDMSGWQRVVAMRPDSGFLWAAGIGLGVVLLFSMLRLRYTWWPIHPIMFCVWGTQSMKAFSTSFLIGWVIKTMLVKIGVLTGGRMQRVKCLMIGLIAGDLLAGLIFMCIGPIYYAVTGKPPEPYYVFPH